MKVRVIRFTDFTDFCYDSGIDMSSSELTDEQFMNIYNNVNVEWEFNSLADFADAFNTDSAYAPTPDAHLIRFFENE